MLIKTKLLRVTLIPNIDEFSKEIDFGHAIRERVETGNYCRKIDGKIGIFFFSLLIIVGSWRSRHFQTKANRDDLEVWSESS